MVFDSVGNGSKAKLASNRQDRDWFMKSKFPVLFPAHPAFTLPQSEFEAFIRRDLATRHDTEASAAPVLDDGYTATENSATLLTGASTTADLRDGMNDFTIEETGEDKASGGRKTDTDAEDKPEHPFVKGLVEYDNPEIPDMSNKMLTENSDVAYRSSNNALVDLFSELEEVVSGPRLVELLNAAWRVNSVATLKIIFNARSIHLGKSSRSTTYRCFSWLAKHHPLTLVSNLQWLSRPVIEKKVAKKTGDDEEIVMIQAEKNENDPTRFDVMYGVAHGYWKDLLNILALSANDKLDPFANPKDVLNVERPTKKRDINWDVGDAKHRRRETKETRHAEATTLFENDPVHRTLHITIARLFAEQLKADLVRLRSGDGSTKRHITLCAKWAPSQKLFHDKHTFIVSSIAELLHPQSEYPDVPDREAYLRRARESYRKDVASLRKALEVVERDITAKTFEKIKYDHVPSIAMNNYAGLFAEKDTERFEKYIDKVAEGKKKISGAVLPPSKLILSAMQSSGSDQYASYSRPVKRNAKGAAKTMIEQKLKSINAKVIDGQWKSLVQRIKDSGTLESSIAVCDISGSMYNPVFPDGTTPIHSAIGLSLLLAEVCAPPFGGHFITFSSSPSVQKLDLTTSLTQKVRQFEHSRMGFNTDFVAVFEKLILPMAVENKLKQEDMVKQIFVFSDMQFDTAGCAGERWVSSYERIERKFKAQGYDMPKLIFWNLAGGRAGYSAYSVGDPVAPKPVTYDQAGTALVSGYSQGMLKMFLDNGNFEDPEEAGEIEVVEKEGKDDEETVEVRKKVKLDPVMTVRKAIGHDAYSMLKVFD